MTVAAAVAAVRAEMTDVLVELVRTPSVTGEEAAAQRLVEQVLDGLDLTVDSWCPQRADLEQHASFSDDELPLGERPVVVGRWVVGEGPSTILNGHIDVVPVGELHRWPHDPWAGAIEHGVLWGRGACDMKGGLVAGITAVAALQRAGLRPTGDVLVQSVIGEETGGAGTLATLLRGHAADAAVVLEPTRLAICPVGAGAASFRLHVSGRAAHGAMRLEGASAIDAYVVLHEALHRLEHERRATFTHPAFDAGALVAPISVGRLTAGDWPSTVPERLVAEGRHGVLPGESLDEARQALEAAVAAVAAESGGEPVVEWFEGQFAPAATPVDHPFLARLAACHEQVTGARPAVHGVPYGSDLRFFTNDLGVPAVLYGPGDVAVAHTVDEHVVLDEVFRAAEVVANLLVGADLADA
ncbi:MAG: ArgE/DapE family deacylase [Acidimicrobiia bacterium]|nr:ArgE/DapE family deacylase [Acidimicrobiia bacterium]